MSSETSIVRSIANVVSLFATTVPNGESEFSLILTEMPLTASLKGIILYKKNPSKTGAESQGA
jgi:hypothetical protein